ncbi:MAG: IclR family transcriptional regulator [Shimia sp.]
MSMLSSALTLLDVFTAQRPAIGLSELKRLTGKDKATVFRHATALTDARLLTQDPTTRAYRLGPQLALLSARRTACHSIAQRLAGAASEVADRCGAPATIFTLDGATLTVIEAEGEAIPIAPPLSSSAGTAILAFAPVGRVAEVEAAHPNADAAGDIIATIRAVERQGYVATTPEPSGLPTLAVPIFEADGTPAAACAIVGTAPKALLASAAELTHRVGGYTPPSLAKVWPA